MQMDSTMTTAIGNNLLRSGVLLLKRGTAEDRRQLQAIAETVAEAHQVLERALGRVVLAPPKGEAAERLLPSPLVIDDEVA